MGTPRVSVVIPAFNVERFIGEAIGSILAQSFVDFELIVVNDCSTDGTVAAIKQFVDPRVHLVEHTENQGPSAARNTGIQAAEGAYIAFLDGDDIAAPSRLEEQAKALDLDDRLVLVGSWLEVLSENGRLTGRVWRRPEDPDESAATLLFSNVLHSPTMARRTALPKIPFRLPMAEDYDFNARLSQVGRVKSLPKPLTQIRVRQAGLTRTLPEAMEECARKVVAEQLTWLGISPTLRELDLHRHAGALILLNSEPLLGEVENWLLKLWSANQESQRFNRAKFELVLGRQWLGVCKFASEIGGPAWRKYWSSPLARMWKPPLGQVARFAVKCGVRHKRPR